MNKEQGVDFLQTQNCVLTEDSAAVTCENGSDAHFGNENQITFEKIRILGTGGSAQVEEVTSKTTGRAFARKLLHRLGLVRVQSSLHHFANELKILRKLQQTRGPNRRKLHGTTVCRNDHFTGCEVRFAQVHGGGSSYSGLLTLAANIPWLFGNST